MFLSGLVSWTSALTGEATSEQVATFFERYDALPVVSLGAYLKHQSQVTINGYQGMRELIFHLVDVHGYRRIAFIRGPQSHPYAQTRVLSFSGKRVISPIKETNQER
jgi:DNA-binding LacI/PurR family transcriptional regulator